MFVNINKYYINLTQGSPNFFSRGHIDDILRLGGPKVQKNSIYLKYGE